MLFIPGPVFLIGEKINLRTVEEEDVEFLRDNTNRTELRESLSREGPLNFEQEKEFFEEAISSDEHIHLATCSGKKVL